MKDDIAFYVEEPYIALSISSPVAGVILVASKDALLNVIHVVGVNKVTLTLLCLVTISHWATENE